MNDRAGSQHRVAKLFLTRNIRSRRAFFHYYADADGAEDGAGVGAHLAVFGETVEHLGGQHQHIGRRPCAQFFA
jgi:hypothetical protein